MNIVEIVIGLVLVAVILSIIAQRMRIPHPTLMVLGGLALGFAPGLPHIEIAPDITFLIFIPPLVYLVAAQFGLRDLRSNMWPILRLSIGLVLLNIISVACIAHWGIDGFTWSTAFVLAAIISPTDTAAVTAITNQIPIPKRTERVLEGESLFNDVVALVAYQQAVQATVTGTFSIGELCGSLVWEAFGGISIGLAIGMLVTWARHRVHDSSVNTAASLLTPFAAYLAADAMSASGILATVATGLYVGHALLPTLRPEERLQTFSFWVGVRFILEGLAFVLIGFQLQTVLTDLTFIPALELLGDGLLIGLATIIIRIVWVFAWTVLPIFFWKQRSNVVARPAWGHAILLSWSGMRGVSSLAAALAIPLVMADGTTPFPQRNLILFLSFSVILTTLVLQGMTLPALIRRLGFPVDDGVRREEAQVRLAAAEAAMNRLEELEQDMSVPSATVAHLRKMYQLHIRRYQSRLGLLDSDESNQGVEEACGLMLELLQAERQAVITMRAQGLISNDAMQQVERSLDYEELKLLSEGSLCPT